MASTLLSTGVYASKASPHFEMPQVFVVPPEEDETPAWCYFDASASASVLNTDSPHHVLDILGEELDASLLPYDLKGPRSLLDSIPMPKRNGDHETRSIMDVFMNTDSMAMNSEKIEEELDSETNVGNDSEVVEVVKVGRYTADAGDLRTSTSPTYTSKSLKARASGVFRSLKNAGKSSLRSRSKAGDASEGVRNKTPRHSYAVFSQPSSPPTTPKSSPSVSSFDLVEVSSIFPLEGSRYPSSLRNVSFSNARPFPPTALAFSSTASLDSRNPSPTPSTSNRRHFSMMTFNRIFSFSQSDELSSDAVPVSRSRNSSGPSTESSSEPETPTEDSAPFTPGHALPPGPKGFYTGATTPAQGDISFELKLDSLHFDPLSFDVDRF
ncbi:hypothetical protein C0989_006707 [Termitomyces sp. Mn162]|nr:hypothetical protein C0989_006707 [Termitomyces sp. Mn162]